MTNVPARLHPQDLDVLESATEEINRLTGKRIDDIRSSMRITKKEMSTFLGLSYGGLVSKLTGRRSFQFSEVVRLANWWHLSLDELVSDIPVTYVSNGRDEND